MIRLLFSFSFLILFFSNTIAQKLFYAQPEREDARNLSFDIVGKYGQQFLIYKNYNNRHSIAVYDPDMQLRSRIPLDFIPDRVSEVQVFANPENIVFIYQYQRKSILYCMGAVLDAQGKLSSEPVLLDTTQMNLFSTNSKVYSVISSDDKRKIMVFKMKNRFQDEFHIQTFLFSSNLKPLRHKEFDFLLENNRESITDFSLDNEGNFLFVQVRQQLEKEYISKATVCIYPLNGDSVLKQPLTFNDKFVDEIRIKVDNTNGNYLLASFYSNAKRGTIDGLYLASVGKGLSRPVSERIYEFGEEMRKQARGDNNIRNAFNDYYLKQFIVRKDGGLLITAESAYTSSRGNNLNRWDNPFLWGNPWSMQPGSYWGWNSWNSWGGWGSPWGWGGFGNNQTIRYYSDHVMIFSFDKNAGLQWNTMLAKSQFDDHSDHLLSYQLMNSGTELLFLYNEWMRREPVLSAASLDATGNLQRQQPLRSLDKGYDFMIRFGKQVSAREMIVPAYYRNATAFVRIEF